MDKKDNCHFYDDYESWMHQTAHQFNRHLIHNGCTVGEANDLTVGLILILSAYRELLKNSPELFTPPN